MDQKTQKQETIHHRRLLHIEIVRQMLTLATSGFGLVSALAWNNLVQEFVNNYLKIWFPKGSSIISLLLYALIITTLAVIVTMQLSKLVHRLEQLEEERNNNVS